MLFAVRVTDKAGTSAIRQKFLPAHLRWLEEHQSSVLVAGALRGDAHSAPIGALWIVSAETKEEAEDLFRSDPFWQQGMRQSFEILQWTKAFPERRVTV
jgi:uncharacterized protein YciI